MSMLATCLRRLGTDRSGNTVIEFALAFPVMLLLGGYGAELSNFAYANLQISQYALALADNASRIGVNNGQQTFQLREGDINDILQGARLMSSGLKLTTNGRVTVTSLEKIQRSFSDVTTGDTAPVLRMHWQRCIGKRGGTADAGYDSSFGGATPLLTAGIDTTYANRGPTVTGMGTSPVVTAPSGAGVMFVEINYEYQPLFGTMFMAKKKIRSTAALIVRDRRDFSQIYNPKTALGTTPPRATCDLYGA